MIHLQIITIILKYSFIDDILEPHFGASFFSPKLKCIFKKYIKTCKTGYLRCEFICYSAQTSLTTNQPEFSFCLFSIISQHPPLLVISRLFWSVSPKSLISGFLNYQPSGSCISRCIYHSYKLSLN